jgi:hypothetical protein
MGAILKDAALDVEFRRKGYVTYPLLDAEQVAALLELHDATTPDVPRDYYATPFSQSPDYRWHLYEGITEIMGSSLAHLLPDYETCMGGFITKRAHTTQGRVPLHQDYSFVDNESHVAVHVWCPLIDTNAQNGCIKAVDGSHTFFNHISAIPGNPAPFHAVAQVLEREFMTSLPLAAGWAFVYDERTLHASDDNLSGSLRIAAGCALVPQGVAPRMYSFEKGRPGQLGVLQVNARFLSSFQAGQHILEPYPDGVRRIGSVSYTPRSVGPEELTHLHGIQEELRAVGAARL